MSRPLLPLLLLLLPLVLKLPTARPCLSCSCCCCCSNSLERGSPVSLRRHNFGGQMLVLSRHSLRFSTFSFIRTSAIQLAFIDILFLQTLNPKISARTPLTRTAALKAATARPRPRACLLTRHLVSSEVSTHLPYISLYPWWAFTPNKLQHSTRNYFIHYQTVLNAF